MRPIDAYKTNMQIIELYNGKENEQVKSALRDVMKIIREAPTIAPPPNDPLTLDELRKMDGEPVYVTSSIGEHPMWYIVDVEENELKNLWDRITLEEWDEGYPYRAYRRKPEEGTE